MPIPVLFSLSTKERSLAIAEGVRRQSDNDKVGLLGRNGGPASGEDALRIHLLGAAGEMAVASYLGMKEFLYKNHGAIRNSCDLPPDIDVKTRARHSYDLICQRDECNSKRLVLVTIEKKIILIHGWMASKDAMDSRWINEPVKGRSAFFVPKEHLLPISSLITTNYTLLDNEEF
jgi:hypothetical protein